MKVGRISEAHPPQADGLVDAAQAPYPPYRFMNSYLAPTLERGSQVQLSK